MSLSFCSFRLYEKDNLSVANYNKIVTTYQFSFVYRIGSWLWWLVFIIYVLFRQRNAVSHARAWIRCKNTTCDLTRFVFILLKLLSCWWNSFITWKRFFCFFNEVTSWLESIPRHPLVITISFLIYIWLWFDDLTQVLLAEWWWFGFRFLKIFTVICVVKSVMRSSLFFFSFHWCSCLEYLLN